MGIMLQLDTFTKQRVSNKTVSKLMYSITNFTEIMNLLDIISTELLNMIKIPRDQLADQTAAPRILKLGMWVLYIT